MNDVSHLSSSPDYPKESPPVEDTTGERKVHGPDGEVIGSDVDCVPVTRHGLQESGITCVRCNNLAVEPGDWTKVCIDDRIRRIPKEKRKSPEDWRTEEWQEESVPCPYCNAMLLASPDDDIDTELKNLKEGEDYDKDIYHRFVRPEGWVKPTRRTIEKELEVNDPVVVEDGYLFKTEDGIEHDLSGAEGMVKEVNDTTVILILAGLSGDVGLIRPEVPKDKLKVVGFETMRKGDRVLILRGKAAGQEGTFKGSILGENHVVEVELEDGNTIETVIERIRKIYV
jgi:hypothetical protein